MGKIWRKNAANSSTAVLPVKYEFLLDASRKHALNAALTCIVAISLSLAIIIAVFTEALRRRATSTGRGAG